MDLDIGKHLPEDFDPGSRAWIYQGSRLFFINEALEMEDLLNDFVLSWKSHGAPVKGFANLFFGRFIIFLADEKSTGVSGCSTDSSVRIIKEIEKKYNVDMFNRQSLAFIVKNKIELIPLAQLQYAIDHNFINADTLYFNNTVLNKEQIITQWIIPAKESWLKKHFEKSKTGN